MTEQQIAQRIKNSQRLVHGAQIILEANRNGEEVSVRMVCVAVETMIENVPALADRREYAIGELIRRYSRTVYAA